jgi:hypothetical protein
MNRRAFVAGLGAVLAAPVAAEVQTAEKISAEATAETYEQTKTLKAVVLLSVNWGPMKRVRRPNSRQYH